jgi:signal transduction histidine kinase
MLSERSVMRNGAKRALVTSAPQLVETPPLLTGFTQIFQPKDQLRTPGRVRNDARLAVEIARAIHDDVVQRMFATSLVLRDQGPLSEDERELCADQVERALRDLREILRRAVSGADLAPAPNGLAAALAELARESVEVRVLGDGILDPRQEAIACGVLAEAVRNARKHAVPKLIRVTADRGEEMLSLTVTNDGVDGGGSGGTGVGLRIAATEAAQGGGLLEHGPEGPDGWTVRLLLPREERDELDFDHVASGNSTG